jgi:hypothetical protein
MYVLDPVQLRPLLQVCSLQEIREMLDTEATAIRSQLPSYPDCTPAPLRIDKELADEGCNKRRDISVSK